MNRLKRYILEVVKDWIFDNSKLIAELIGNDLANGNAPLFLDEILGHIDDVVMSRLQTSLIVLQDGDTVLITVKSTEAMEEVIKGLRRLPNLERIQVMVTDSVEKIAVLE